MAPERGMVVPEYIQSVVQQCYRLRLVPSLDKLVTYLVAMTVGTIDNPTVKCAYCSHGEPDSL